jgi:DNA-binding transcriptional LysR family regulator
VAKRLAVVGENISHGLMDLKRIHQFVILAETLSFRRAAERLNMAQPPLSVSIRKLEEELGTKLFTRSTGGVSLTLSGQAILKEARQLLFHGSQLRETAKGVRDGTGGALQVGFVGSTTYGLLQKLLPLFRAEYPGVELVLREAASVGILQQVEDRALDVGLVRVPLVQASRATLVLLESDEYVAALPRGNRLSNKGILKLSEMAGESFIMYAPAYAAGLHATTMLACQQAGFVPRVVQQATQIQTVLALVESGLGVALVPSVMRRFISDRIVYRPLEDLPSGASIGLALAYMADSESSAASRFRELSVRAFPLSRSQYFGAGGM